MFEMERIAEDLGQVVAGLEPACLEGRDAARLTEVAARIERLGATAKTLLARRTAETGAWRRGRAASIEQWLAQASGCSEGTARDALATAQRLDALPATAEQLRSGKLSLAQAAHVSAGATADPGAEARLARTARRPGMRALRAERERVIAAATDELEGRRQAKQARHLRTWTRGFATHGSFSGPTDEVARVLAVLEPLTKARFDQARAAGERESHARKILSHGLLQLVITDGVDVQTVVSNTRRVPTSLAIAIAERDRTCKIRGCDCDRMLERHHTVDYADTHRTTYEELGNLCPRHHEIVTHRGSEIIPNDEGTWDLRARANAPPGEAAA